MIMKLQFSDFVKDLLKYDNIMSDEEICSKWIHYKYSLFLVTEKNISVIGKSFETHRKMLWKYRRKFLEESFRKLRKNGSHEIFYKLKNVC